MGHPTFEEGYTIVWRRPEGKRGVGDKARRSQNPHPYRTKSRHPTSAREIQRLRSGEKSAGLKARHYKAMSFVPMRQVGCGDGGTTPAEGCFPTGVGTRAPCRALVAALSRTPRAKCLKLEVSYVQGLWSADFDADDFAGDYDLDAAISLTPGGGFVVGYGIGFAESLGAHGTKAAPYSRLAFQPSWRRCLLRLLLRHWLGT